LETGWPVVQILLICKTAIFNPVVTPFDTTLTPPKKAIARKLIALKGKPTDIVDPISLTIPKVRRESVLDNRYRVASDFIIDWCRLGEEEKVRVQVGNQVNFRPVI